MRLSDLKAGESAVIVKILGHGAFRKRMIEMGFVRGKRIKAILTAPLRDPVKYSLMGYEVSLRRTEANLVEVVADDRGDSRRCVTMTLSTTRMRSCRGSTARAERSTWR